MSAPGATLPESLSPARMHLVGVAATAAGAIAWSLGALLIRLTQIDAWTLLFWRSSWVTFGALVYVLAVHRGAALAALRGAGWGIFLAGLLMALSMCLYVNSITRTSVANTLILLATNPFLTAILAWAALGERVAAHTWIAMAIALAGMTAMLGDSIGGGSWFGDLLAICAAGAFAATLVVLRRFKHQDTAPQVLFAGLWAMALSLPAATPAAASLRDILLCAVMGIFSLGLGLMLVVYGVRFISAAEAGLLSLLESILAPIWVWLALGEEPRPMALLGGALVLGAVAAHVLLTARPPARA